MEHTKGIYWLASYPKSGNTWLRIFIAQLLKLSIYASNKKIKNSDTADLPLSINSVNELIHDDITTCRSWINNAAGFNTAYLSDDEIDHMLPQLYCWYAEKQSDISYHKTHRAYTYNNANQPIIPSKGCLGAIYIIRNPLDVAVSMANHFDCTIDEAINIMNNKQYALNYYPLRQWLLSWSQHVTSWLNAHSINRLIIRYEDMLMNPENTFTTVADFLKIKTNANFIKKAIEQSSFKKLQAFEKTVGFWDKPPTVKNFFRRGIAGDWKQSLTEKQVQRIIASHNDVMEQWGYINNHAEMI